MRGQRPLLKPWPLALLVFCAAIGPLPFGLVGFALHTAGRSIVAWAALGALAAPALTWWYGRSPAPNTGEGIVASVWAAAAALFFLAGAGLTLHLWLEVLRVSEYPNTPGWAIAGLTLTAVAYTARLGPENLLRLAPPMAALLALAVCGVLVFAWTLGSAGHLAGGFDPFVAGGSLPAAWPLLLFAAHGTALSPVFARYTDARAYLIPSVAASASAGLLLAGAYVLPLAVWNLGPSLHTEFPLLHAITPVSTIFFPVHRLALLAFILLQMNLIGQLASYLLAAVDLAGLPTFPLTSGIATVLGCVAIAAMAVWPAPSFTVARLAALWSIGGLVLFGALPLVGRRRARAAVPA